MRRTLFDIPRMDCPSEERIIRLALEPFSSIAGLRFDLATRQLTVEHDGEAQPILRALQPLGFGAVLRESHALEKGADPPLVETSANAEGSVLRILLAINGVMFLAEFAAGWIASSTGLVADSLDMFADAAVYALSLAAVGRAVSAQKRAALLSGWLQIVLAIFALGDVARRGVVGSDPVAPVMMGMAVVALVANATCLVLLFKHRGRGVHMKASWIFSTTDVIANCGVIIAGLLVMLLKHSWPDLVVGTAIGLIVLRGGVTIVRLAKATPA